MDVHLAIASKRDTRRYAPGPVAAETERRILDAGRLAGSARNRQPVRMVVAEDGSREAVARCVYAPANVLGAALAVTLVVTPGGNLVDFDAGRAAQNMMLAGWADGVASCPNGVADPDGLARALGLEAPERPVVVLSFGPPADGRNPERRSASRWSAAAPRLPLERVVRRLDGGR